jgi:putative copper resistance protein D
MVVISMVSNILLILINWIHIVAVVIWAGGAILMTFIVMPNLARLPPKDAGPIAGAISKQFTKVGITMAILITVTGVIRMYYTNFLNLNLLLNSSYGQILSVKILIFLAMIVFIAQIISIGKKLESASGPEEAMALQSRIPLISKTAIALGIIAIFLAVGLRHGGF